MITATVKAKTAPESEYSHLLGAFVGDSDGPTLIAIGSLHGNEPDGVLALEEVAAWIDDLDCRIRGRVFLLSGNMRALRQQVRFIDNDLNRAWTEPNRSSVGTPSLLASIEGRELTELDRLLDSILITARSEVYVIDLHSTSAAGPPFATMGDTLRNRRFARRFPVRTLLGIEEQLDGTLLEYLNNVGAVTLGFEGGQHESFKTLENHIAFAKLALVNSGVLSPEDLPDRTELELRLAAGLTRSQFYEVLHREAITAEDEFRMHPGFTNFDPVKKGDHLAWNKRGPIMATRSGVILMPLYQKLGDDGFFLGQRIATFWLYVSALLRRLKIQNIVHWLPGVRRAPQDPSRLVINTRIARLFPLQIFHLLGFRKLRLHGSHLIMSRRRHDTASPFERGE
jgi:succinylglutamate desuccinylase